MLDDSSNSNPPILQPQTVAPLLTPLSLVVGKAWRPLAAFLIAIGSYLSQYIAQLVLVFGLMPFVGSQRLQTWLETPSAQFIGTFLSEIFAVLVVFYFLRRRQIPFTAGVGLQRTSVRKVAAMAIGGIAMYLVLLIVVTSLLKYMPFIKLDDPQAIGFDKHVTGVGLVFAFFSLVVLPPIAEEMIFRGFFFGSLRKYLRFGWSLLLTSLFFGLLHIFTGEKSLLWSAAIDTFLLSVVLCTVREKTGSIWATMVIHALKNSVAFLYLFILHT